MTEIIPLKLLQIEDEGVHLLIEASINNTSVNLLIDTGASQSVFDRELAERIIEPKNFSPEVLDKLSSGIGTNSLESESIIFDSLAIGELKISNYKGILIDLNHVKNAYETLELPLISGKNFPPPG